MRKIPTTDLDREHERGRTAAFEGRKRDILWGLHSTEKYHRWAYVAGWDEAMADLERLAATINNVREQSA